MTLREICLAETLLSESDIACLEKLAVQLGNIANLTGTDIFIDCPTATNEVVVVAHATPSWKMSAYSDSMVGRYALCTDEPAVFEALRTNTQVRDIKAVTQESRDVKQDVVPLENEKGQCIAALIRETDVTATLAQDKKYKKLSESYERLDSSLRSDVSPEYDVRLREMHHRVKNNLQIVASILNLQARNCKDEYAKTVLKENVGRVLTIASIHDMVTDTGEEQGIDCLALLDRLRRGLSSFVPYGKNIDIVAKGDAIMLTSDTASSVALVVNELVTNALLHAFEDRDSGTVVISAIAGKMINTIVVSDNGSGFAPDAYGKGSFGLKIVESTVSDKLHGHLRINSSTTGTRVAFDFKTE